MASPNSSSGEFKLLYFASASSYTKKKSDMLLAPLKISDLFSELEKKYPGIKAKILESCAVTVNLEYVDLDESSIVIKEGDEVAIIPPVSSG